MRSIIYNNNNPNGMEIMLDEPLDAKFIQLVRIEILKPIKECKILNIHCDLVSDGLMYEGDSDIIYNCLNKSFDDGPTIYEVNYLGRSKQMWKKT